MEEGSSQWPATSKSQDSKCIARGPVGEESPAKIECGFDAVSAACYVLALLVRRVMCGFLYLRSKSFDQCLHGGVREYSQAPS